MLGDSFLTRHILIVTICNNAVYQLGRDSSVGIATGYELESPGIESRWGARFTAPVQTGPGARAASYTMGTRSLPRG